MTKPAGKILLPKKYTLIRHSFLHNDADTERLGGKLICSCRDLKCLPGYNQDNNSLPL
jgi:hypothetical protein